MAERSLSTFHQNITFLLESGTNADSFSVVRAFNIQRYSAAAKEKRDILQKFMKVYESSSSLIKHETYGMY